MTCVLIIDDNPAIGSALKLMLSLHDIDSVAVLTPQAGLQYLTDNGEVGLVIQDMNFTEDTTSGDEGIALFNAIRQQQPDMPVILMTAWTQLETAVDLVRNGAADYIAKPWDDRKLLTTVSNLLELSELQQNQNRQTRQLLTRRKALAEHYDLCGLVYASDSMQLVLETAVKIAASDVPVLITGNNGCGKEKIADILHANSRVAEGPLVKVNVGALPEELMEAELFGAEAGAYTGITRKRIGRFEAADGGTLFLDELGNLSASGQAKLLRVLQTGEYQRLGSSETRRAQVRVISATNADLRLAIDRGTFREDLYYRLNVIELNIPPLAERIDDILPLAKWFLGAGQSISPPVARLLQHHPWPGNVRELENACKRAALLAEGRELSVEDFGLKSSSATPPPRLAVEPDRDLIVAALADNQGNISQAARQLGFTRQALYRRLNKFGISG